MGKLFGNKNQNQLNEKQVYERGYTSSYRCILLVVVFTLINCLLLVAKSDTYYLFTAWVPYLLLYLGMYLCGKYPAEYYEGNIADYNFMNNGMFAFLIGAALLIVLLYLVCWYIARKRKVAGIIGGLVLMLIDTGVMLVWCGVSADMIMDIVFHAWIIFSMISGISGYCKLKKYEKEHPELPPEQPTFDINNGFDYNDTNNGNSI
ncbi:MAG: hypothetical protein IKU48_02495 [Clostridia bacterium]|nr:hypothetical protein [Clostridia bacterium]